MFDIINYWLIYGILTIAILALPLYWFTELVDLIIKDISKGDFEDIIRDKYKIPFMEKLGFEFCEYTGNMENSHSNNVLLTILSGVLSVSGIFAFIIGFLVERLPPYQVLHNITEAIIPFSQWILIPVGYLVVRGLLRKGYTFIKRVNALSEKEDK